MQPRLNLITLGVADVAVARAFYERLGFTASSDSNPSVAFFDAGGVVLALFGYAALAEDARLSPAPAKPAFAGMTLAHNVRSEAEVDAVLNAAVLAGARLVKPAEKTFWGGYAGYFSDPDGYFWEVAHNPFWQLDAAERVVLPGSVP